MQAWPRETPIGPSRRRSRQPRRRPDDGDRPGARPRRPAGGGRAGGSSSARSRTPTADGDQERDGFVVLGQGSTDGDGRFRIEATRASIVRVRRCLRPGRRRRARHRLRLRGAQPRCRAADGRDSASSPSRSSAASWSTSTVSRPPGSRSRSTRSRAILPCQGVPFESPESRPHGCSVRLARRAPRLAEGRHHRRPGPVHLHRHRPRPLRLAVRPRPALRPAPIRPTGRGPRRREGGLAGPPSVDDHRGPRPGRRHRPSRSRTP